jgi:hypothetical protein
VSSTQPKTKFLALFEQSSQANPEEPQPKEDERDKIIALLKK